MKPNLKIMIVDDEAPARQRLHNLLEDIASNYPHEIVAEASDGCEALELAGNVEIDVVLIDIRMPRMDGIELAIQLSRLPKKVRFIFLTAYDEHAVKAFELHALHYLLKPVSAAKLSEALERSVLQLQNKMIDAANELLPQGRSRLRIIDRSRIIFLPISEVIYFQAELKYATVRTAQCKYLLDESLTDLEREFHDRFLRVHRNCIVAKEHVLGAESILDTENGRGLQWVLLLRTINERLHVSRRQWPKVKSSLAL